MRILCILYTQWPHRSNPWYFFILILFTVLFGLPFEYTFKLHKCTSISFQLTKLSISFQLTREGVTLLKRLVYIGDVTCQNQAFVAEISCELSYFWERTQFSFHMIYIFMCLCLTNPKLCWSEEAAVLKFCKITELRKQKVKVEI